MKITKKMIDEAERLGACSDAIWWLRDCPRTTQELVRYHWRWSEWALRKMGRNVVGIQKLREYNKTLRSFTKTFNLLIGYDADFAIFLRRAVHKAFGVKYLQGERIK